METPHSCTVQGQGDVDTRVGANSVVEEIQTGQSKATRQKGQSFVESWLLKPASESYVHIRDPPTLARKVAAVLSDGPSHLHMIADFDMTMTKYWVNGERGNSIYALIERSPTTTPEFRATSKRLYEKYYPNEIDPHISREEKYLLMESWAREGNANIVAEGIRRADLSAMVHANPLTWRDGIRPLVEHTGDLDIYFMVFSAGIKDLIQVALREADLLRPHIHIVSNKMVFDGDGDDAKLIEFEDPVIHPLNKSEIVLRADSDAAHRHLEAIRARNNVILLGDSLGDAHMADGVPHNTCIRVGFCNHGKDAWLDKFARAFDVVVTDDSGFDWVLDLLALIRGSSSACGDGCATLTVESLQKAAI